jgi:hypothetical protein
VQWAPPVLQDMNEKLSQLGLKACPVCGSETAQHVDMRPVIVSVGGVAWSDKPGGKDSETNIDYLFRVECALCGYTMLFNSHRFITGDTPAFGPRQASALAPQGWPRETTRA